jgi:DNA-binding NarL/FixJ family response regulator
MKRDSNTNAINIILVDDHKILLDSLKALIEKEKDICLVNTFSKPKEALEFIRQKPNTVDVVVLDISMEDSVLNGKDVCLEIKQDAPHLKVLILTTHNDSKYVSALIAAKADGYILKQNGGDELIEGIKTVADGENFYSKEIIKVVIDRLQNIHKAKDQHGDKVRLTSREIEVLSLLGKGLKAREVADILHIEKSTVETHKLKIRQKLGLKDLKAIIIFARDNGYVMD